MHQKIELINVKFSYKGGFRVLGNINFSMSNNEFIAIVGPSGCGKTTLLKLIGGLLKPTKGKILFDGEPVYYAKKKRFFGFVFQDPTLLPWRTVIENIKLPNEIIGSSILNGKELLKLVKLNEFTDKYPYQLSGGMKQRVAIARSLSFNPKIMLMDEPFGALDDITREYLNLELLRIWQNMKNNVLFVTHSLSEAVFLADRVIVLSDRPVTIKKIINVDLPRPRDINLKYTQKFNKIVKDARKYLNEKK